jgi:hypothetical protein
MDSNEGYELRDARISPILRFGIGLTLFLVLLYVATFWLFDRFAAREANLKPPLSPLALSNRPKVPPEPRLELAPNRQLSELRAHEDFILRSYGWVDHDAGIVRIPVERAMDLLVERGLPAHADAESNELE